MQGQLMSLLKSYPPTENSNPELMSFWAGQSASLVQYRDAKVLMEALVREMYNANA